MRPCSKGQGICPPQPVWRDKSGPVPHAKCRQRAGPTLSGGPHIQPPTRVVRGQGPSLQSIGWKSPLTMSSDWRCRRKSCWPSHLWRLGPAVQDRQERIAPSQGCRPWCMQVPSGRHREMSSAFASCSQLPVMIRDLALCPSKGSRLTRLACLAAISIHYHVPIGFRQVPERATSRRTRPCQLGEKFGLGFPFSARLTLVSMIVRVRPAGDMIEILRGTWGQGEPESYYGNHHGQGMAACHRHSKTST